MANATITAPTTIQNGSTVSVTLDVAIAALADANIQLTGRTENGASGVTFTISGTGTNWTLTFAVPATSEGSFEIRIVGMVTQTASGSMPEGVMSDSAIVHYDTTSGVTATLGAVEYRDGGVIAVPVAFGENVIAPSKSIFEITHVSGDALTAIVYRLIGAGTAFALIFEIPPDRKGRFEIGAKGDVFKVASSVWDNVKATPKTISYNTIVPRLVDYDIPENYTPGANFDVRIAYNVQVTGLSDNNVHQVFLLEGAADMMGTPTPYKWTGDSPPDFDVAVPEDLTGTDWQQLQSPPADVPTTAENEFDANGFWHGAANEGQYFLIRWVVQENTSGIFSMTPRDGTVRGPVSS